jgi:hypothetical protein
MKTAGLNSFDTHVNELSLGHTSQSRAIDGMSSNLESLASIALLSWQSQEAYGRTRTGVCRLFHKLRSFAIENWDEYFKCLFEGHRQG